MSKIQQPASLPTANHLVSRQTRESSSASPSRTSFYLTAANMGWQLAIVVLVPVFIGYKLDESHNSSLFIVLGLGVAVVGASLVVWRQFQRFTPPTEEQHK